MQNKIKIDYHNLIFLDGLRGLAALYVMIGHARWLLWEGYEAYLNNPLPYTLLDKLQVYFFSLFRYGREAVLFFFILSGFVIHLRYAKRIMEHGDQATFDFWNYFYRRVRRIYPPFLFAIVLTFTIDHIGLHLGYSIYQSQTAYPLINESVDPNYGLATLIGNLFFLMRVYVPVWGSNGPLWSLMYEWWFYLLYPLFFFLSRKSIWLAFGVMGSLFLLSFFASFWPILLLQRVFGLMLTWWMGALLADIFVGRIKIPYLFLIPLVLLVPVGLFGQLSFTNNLLNEHIVALGFIGIISACFLYQEKIGKLTYLTKLKWLGDLSYTLYVAHFPILVLMSGWLMSNANDGALPAHFFMVYLGILLILLFAYGMHFLVELPFMSRNTK